MKGPLDRVPFAREDYNIGNNFPYSLQTVFGRFFNLLQGCETGPIIYGPYLRRLDSLNIFR